VGARSTIGPCNSVDTAAGPGATLPTHLLVLCQAHNILGTEVHVILQGRAVAIVITTRSAGVRAACKCALVQCGSCSQQLLVNHSALTMNTMRSAGKPSG
jgi:hypothetical protein